MNFPQLLPRHTHVLHCRHSPGPPTPSISRARTRARWPPLGTKTRPVLGGETHNRTVDTFFLVLPSPGSPDTQTLISRGSLSAAVGQSLL